MLEGDFFTIEKIQKEPEILVEIKMNPKHEVYKGHFATQPVAPGVCLTQMFKEIVMHLTGKDLILVNGDNLRFTSLLDPNTNPQVVFNIQITEAEDGIYKAKGVLTFEETKFFTIQAKFLEKQYFY